MPKFNIGDVVELNSGSEKMTVVNSTSETVVVIYYNPVTGTLTKKEDLSSYVIKLSDESTNSGPSVI